MHLTFSGNSSECVSIDTSNRSEECDLAQSTEGGNTNTSDICHPIFISDDLVVLCVCLCACVLGVCKYMTGLLCVWQRCSECPEPRLAQSLCTFCNKWLCYQCTDMHQHQRATPQCSDLHQHQKPTTQCVDLHQRDQMAPSSLPPPEPGKHLSLPDRFPHPSLPLQSPHSGVSGRLGGDGLRFPGVVIRPVFLFLCFNFFPCLFVNHVSVGMIVMNYACSL